MADSGSGSGASDWLTLLGNLYTHYRAGEEARSQVRNAQNQAMQMWQQGYWSQQSPYMANEINPLLRAVLGEQLRLYNGQRGHEGLGMLDMSNFLTGIPGVGVDPNAPGAGGVGGPGGTATGAPFGSTGPGRASNPNLGSDGAFYGVDHPDLPHHEGSGSVDLSGAGPAGAGMMDGSNTYLGGGNPGSSAGSGSGFADWLYNAGQSLGSAEQSHPWLTRGASTGINVLTGSPVGSALSHLPQGMQWLASLLGGGPSTPDSQLTASGRDPMAGYGDASLETLGRTPVPSSVINNGWGNQFAGDSADFWRGVLGGNGLGQNTQFAGLLGGGASGHGIYAGTSSPWGADFAY